MGEMLEKGGNPWRGMIYGMTGRLPYMADPRPIWRLWDDFGMAGSRMIGYWAPDCPVRTDSASVLATVYRKPKKALVAIASWAAQKVDCRLTIDFTRPCAGGARVPAGGDLSPLRPDPGRSGTRLAANPGGRGLVRDLSRVITVGHHARSATGLESRRSNGHRDCSGPRGSPSSRPSPAERRPPAHLRQPPPRTQPSSNNSLLPEMRSSESTPSAVGRRRLTRELGSCVRRRIRRVGMPAGIALQQSPPGLAMLFSYPAGTTFTGGQRLVDAGP